MRGCRRCGSNCHTAVRTRNGRMRLIRRAGRADVPAERFHFLEGTLVLNRAQRWRRRQRKLVPIHDREWSDVAELRLWHRTEGRRRSPPGAGNWRRIERIGVAPSVGATHVQDHLTHRSPEPNAGRLPRPIGNRRERLLERRVPRVLTLRKHPRQHVMCRARRGGLRVCEAIDGRCQRAGEPIAVAVAQGIRRAATLRWRVSPRSRSAALHPREWGTELAGRSGRSWSRYRCRAVDGAR